MHHCWGSNQEKQCLVVLLLTVECLQVYELWLSLRLLVASQGCKYGLTLYLKSLSYGSTTCANLPQNFVSKVIEAAWGLRSYKRTHTIYMSPGALQGWWLQKIAARISDKRFCLIHLIIKICMTLFLSRFSSGQMTKINKFVIIIFDYGSTSVGTSIFWVRVI